MRKKINSVKLQKISAKTVRIKNNFFLNKNYPDGIFVKTDQYFVINFGENFSRKIFQNMKNNL